MKTKVNEKILPLIVAVSVWTKPKLGKGWWTNNIEPAVWAGELKWDVQLQPQKHKYILDYFW